jgi:hypothetical protein
MHLLNSKSKLPVNKPILRCKAFSSTTIAFTSISHSQYPNSVTPGGQLRTPNEESVMVVSVVWTVWRRRDNIRPMTKAEEGIGETGMEWSMTRKSCGNVTREKASLVQIIMRGVARGAQGERREIMIREMIGGVVKVMVETGEEEIGMMTEIGIVIGVGEEIGTEA